MKKIPENVLIIIKSIVPLVIIVVLFVILANLGFGKIAEIRAQIGTARHDQGVLTEKLDLLRTVAVTGVEDANVATNSLPDTSPALAAMSQLKTLAANSNLVLRSLKATGSSGGVEDVSSIQISFNIVGAKSDIENFLTNISTFAPITRLDTVKISEAGGTSQGDIAVKSFWAPLPTKLPATIEEFQDLTPEDRQTLSSLSTLTPPALMSLPPPSGEVKQDPFSP